MVKANSAQNQHYEGKIQSRITKQTRTSKIIRSRISCHGGVRILFWLVTPAVIIRKYLTNVQRHRLVLNTTFILYITCSIYFTCRLVLMSLHTITHKMIKSDAMLYIHITCLYTCMLVYQNACASNLSGSKLNEY